VSSTLEKERLTRFAGRTVGLQNALQIPDRITFDDWFTLGRQIKTVVDASAWWIGDWLYHGQETYPDRYAQALELLTLEYGTLRNYAYVSGRIDVSRRRDTLSFAHHATVAPFPVPEQERWLDRAEAEGLTRDQLRQAIAGRGAEHSPLPIERLHLPVPPERFARWQQAAERSGQTVTDWAAGVLDAAAEAA
jgi:hypothetical protein